MKRVSPLLAALLLSACAATPPQDSPRVERLTAEQLAAKLPPPTAIVTLDDIVAMGREGRSAGEIVAKLKESHSRHRLTAGQILALREKKVPVEVLDYLLEAERQAVLDDLAGELVRRDQACQENLQQEVRLCRLQSLGAFPMMPLSTCLPPRPGYPAWRCF